MDHVTSMCRRYYTVIISHEIVTYIGDTIVMYYNGYMLHMKPWQPWNSYYFVSVADSKLNKYYTYTSLLTSLPT